MIIKDDLHHLIDELDDDGAREAIARARARASMANSARRFMHHNLTGTSSAGDSHVGKERPGRPRPDWN